jgi:hypothetical protein
MKTKWIIPLAMLAVAGLIAVVWPSPAVRKAPVKVSFLALTNAGTAYASHELTA